MVEITFNTILIRNEQFNEYAIISVPRKGYQVRQWAKDTTVSDKQH